MNLEIKIYLSDGQTAHFTQTDPKQIQASLEHLRPASLFDDGPLIVGDAERCIFFAPERVSRIDLITTFPISQPETPAWRRIIEDPNLFEVNALAAIAAAEDGVQPGTKYTGYVRFELAGGHLLLIEIERQLLPQTQFFTNMHRIPQAPAMVLEHPAGGAIVVNTKNILVAHCRPGFSDFPRGTWLVSDYRS